MAIKRLGEHYYPEDGYIWEVSAEAAQEVKDNHIELGWADGVAYVKHPDWHALLEHYHAHYRRSYGGPCGADAYLINAHGPDGKIAHIGGICQCMHKPGYITLSG